jgi:hypothetical protein
MKKFITWFFSNRTQVGFAFFAFVITCCFAYGIATGDFIDNEVIGFIAGIVLIWVAISVKLYQNYKEETK